MGFRFGKSFKIGPARMTFSKSGISKSVGVKGLRITKTAKGRIKTTMSIPSSGLSYTSESESRKKKAFSKSSRSRSVGASYSSHDKSVSNTSKCEQQTAKRPANPPKPPKSSKIYLPCGILLAVLGVLMLPLFWPFGLISLGVGVYYITCGPNIYSKLAENYKLIHPEFEENTKQ